VVDELLPAETFEETVMRRAAKLGSFPREAYAHSKGMLVAEAVARIEAETDPEMMRTAAVWVTGEQARGRAAGQLRGIRAALLAARAMASARAGADAERGQQRRPLPRRCCWTIVPPVAEGGGRRPAGT
jgi:hypothetical protein